MGVRVQLVEEERRGRGRVAFGCHWIWIWKWMLGFLAKRQVEIYVEQAWLETFEGSS